MDWKLIFGLSAFGFAMAIATVSLVPPSVEPMLWLAIFLACPFLIARQRSTGQFLHGFLVGIVNSVWVTAAHVLFFAKYLSNHPKEAAMMSSMPAPDSPRLMMMLIGPVVGVVSGIVIGFLAWVASKVIKSRIDTTASS